ncbi:hypothetical protein E1176_02005 [Fulvivirga sp. RKSG066]|uniref:hypothetical protein n=1 Tax=Fulvivirga aurantia TaxID=2529383 RepID=UPI0012BC7638|nr:hypothetical protein [Fulvivirga aurantia]MTI19786.1 hypothetical protein [Fulvivirga aurantia]
MNDWRNTMGLGAFDNIRRMQEQIQASMNPLLKQQQMMADIVKSSGLLKAQEQIARSFSGVNMMTNIAKSLKQQAMITQSTFSAIDAFSHTMSWQAKFAIPQTTIDAITSINRQHEQIFGSVRSIIESVKFQSPIIAQINSLNFALNGISGQLAAIAAQQRNWSILEDFENVTEQALEFTETLSEELEEEQERKFQILLSLVLSFLSKHKSLGVSALLIIDIFLRYAGFHQYYDFLQTKPELATKEELSQIGVKQDSTVFFIQQITGHLKQAKEYRITNRHCTVKLKPKQKTITITKLPVDFDVVVIQVHHKWVYVSYFDPKDNLPQTGWIKKKYLNKPKEE